MKYDIRATHWKESVMIIFIFVSPVHVLPVSGYKIECC